MFMIDDSGDRVSDSVWSAGWSKGVEIEIVDPLTREKGWCYLLFFALHPPARSSFPDYVEYDYQELNSIRSFPVA